MGDREMEDRAMGYKLIQVGYTTFGSGETAEAAREDARQWLDHPADADDVPVCESVMALSGTSHGALVIVTDDMAASMGDY
jgi:hypothetical protein